MKDLNNDIKKYLESYPIEISDKFNELYKIISDLNVEINDQIWAKLPSFYVKEKFVRLIPFNDHINIEASGITNYLDLLKEYKITKKGMLQLFLKDEIPYTALKIIFKETL